MTDQLTSDTFANIYLTKLASSLTNPRKTFNPVKLQELADSIKASSVHQPILVRPLPGVRISDTFDTSEPGTRPAFEIVAGERRYRASKLAGATTIPAMIRQLTDDQVLEIQIIENLQRDDLTDLEAAEGYAALMKHNNLTAEQVGQKIGKSRTFVYNCLKLLDLHVDSAKALREGTIDASTALLIARIPDDKLQIKALEYATKANSYNGNTPSIRELKSWLRQNVMLPLDDAPFPIAVKTLVPAAGNCTDCTKRTGANPDLFADVDSADICTDPPCYHLKSETHHTNQIAAAEKMGFRFVDGKEADELCDWRGLREGYTSLSQIRNDATDTEGQTLGELLGKDAPEPVLIQHPRTKELIKAVPTAQAEALLLSRGLVKAIRADDEDDLEELVHNINLLKTQTALKADEAARVAIMDTLIDHIYAVPDNSSACLLSPELLRAWLTREIDHFDHEDIAFILDMPPLVADFTDDMAEFERNYPLRIQRGSESDLHRWVTTIMLITDREDRQWRVENIQPTKLFNAYAADHSIDLAPVRKEAADQIEADTKKKLSALNKQLKDLKKAQTPPAETTSTPPPAGAAIDTGAATQYKGSKTKPPAALRKPKTTAQEAKAGIAAAMQGLGSGSLDASLGEPESAAVESGVNVLGVGSTVKVRVDKHAGRIGPVTHANGHGLYSVELSNKIGKFTMVYKASEIEAVTA